MKTAWHNATQFTRCNIWSILDTQKMEIKESILHFFFISNHSLDTVLFIADTWRVWFVLITRGWCWLEFRSQMSEYRHRRELESGISFSRSIGRHSCFLPTNTYWASTMDQSQLKGYFREWNMFEQGWDAITAVLWVNQSDIKE